MDSEKKSKIYIFATYSVCVHVTFLKKKNMFYNMTQKAYHDVKKKMTSKILISKVVLHLDIHFVLNFKYRRPVQ